MESKAYKPKDGTLENLETFFAVVAFTEAGMFLTADEFLKSLKPRCREGYRYDEKLELCVVSA